MVKRLLNSLLPEYESFCSHLLWVSPSVSNGGSALTLIRASDRVRQKMENSAAFSREIMRQEWSIMRQIMRFF